jgi:uncharacterized membrane protein
MSESRFSIGDAVNYSWDVMKNNLGFLIPAVLILWLVGGIPGGLQSPFYLTKNVVFAVVGAVIFAILTVFVGVFVNMARIRIGLKFCSGEVPDFPDLVSDYRRFVDFLLGSILYFLIVLGGFILLVIPGIYWSIRYRYYGYLILDKGMTPVDAIKGSGHITRGSWWHLLLFELTMAGIIILGFLVCCVGLLFAWPVVIIATAYVYRSLLAAAPAAGEPQPAPPLEQQQPAE